MIQIRKISKEDSLYQGERLLRQQVLLASKGLVNYPWDSLDSVSEHFVALPPDAPEEVIGCLLLYRFPFEFSRGRLMQMAVKDSWQKKGVGAALVEELLAEAKRQGLAEVLVKSRIEVVGFYETLGFLPDGIEFGPKGFSHLMMRKAL